MDNKRILVKNLKTGHYEYINESDFNKSNGWKYVFLTIFYVAAFGFFVFFFYSLYLDKYKIYLDVNEVYIEQGENYQVELSPKYSDYFNYSNYVYDIEDKSIAEVNDYGEVKAIKNGETVLKVKFKNGYEEEKLALKVSNIDVESLEVKESINIYKDDTEKLKVIVNGQENINAKLLYESSNENVLKVDGLGNITGVEDGTAILKVSSINGISAESTVTVKTVDDDIQELNIREQDVRLYKGETRKLTLDVVPKRVSSKGVKWTSSNDKIVSVDSYGNIKGHSYGTAIISAKTKQGLESSTAVSVEEAPEIILNTYKENIVVGQSLKLKANIDVKWTSSNDKIVSVDENGNIIGKKEGTAVITATNYNKKNSCVVIVKKQSTVIKEDNTQIISMDIKSMETDIEKITLDKTNIDMSVGSTLKLTYTVSPKDMYYDDVTWLSSDTSVVEVDKEGNIKALKEGTAKVTVTSANGKESSAFINVKKSNIQVTSIKLNKNSARIKVGDTINLNATITPSNATIKTINWNSSDVSIATVSSNGNVVALDEGKVIIEARTGNNIVDKCEIIIDPIEVSKIEITNAKVIKVYDSLKLNAIISPSNATNKDVTWSSSNNSVATVTQKGEVTAKKAGDVIITAKSSNNKESSVSIRVIDINPTNIYVSESNINMEVGGEKQLGVSFFPANTTGKRVVWISVDNNVVTVDARGKLKAIKEGTAKIIVYAVNDSSIKAESIVTVNGKNIKPTDIILNNNSSTLYVDSTLNLKATVIPNNATNKNVTWKSSNDQIATVDANGKVTAKKAGKAIITVKASNNIEAECEIKVITPLISVKKIDIKNNVSTVFVGESINLSASISPITASNKSITWSSSNKDIATVDENGKVTGKKAGSVKITVTSKSNPKISGSKSIVVSIKKVDVRSVALNKDKINLYVEDVYKLTPTFTPKDTTEKTLTWTSSNPLVATVDANGNVIAKGVGTAAITATTTNGKSANADVIIKNNMIKNPLRTKDGSYLYGGDPFVTYDSARGYYYYLSTSGRDVTIYASENLQDIGNPVKAVVAYKNEADSYIWAPELHHFGNNWYVYYTWTSKEKNVFARRMYVLKSKTDDPLGEYEYMGKLYDKKHDYYAIDGTVFEWQGKYYFVYSGHKSNSSRRIQNLYIMSMSNPYTVEGERHLLSQPNQLSWDNSDVNEGPEVLIKDNVLRIIYSANGYRNPNYSLAMLTYKGGNILDQKSWNRNSKQVFKKGNGVYATGHASFTKSKDGSEDWIVYHAYETSKLTSRTIRIKKFTWNGNTPVFGSPDAINTPIKVPNGSTITDYTVDY